MKSGAGFSQLDCNACDDDLTIIKNYGIIEWVLLLYNKFAEARLR